MNLLLALMPPLKALLLVLLSRIVRMVSVMTVIEMYVYRMIAAAAMMEAVMNPAMIRVIAPAVLMKDNPLSREKTMILMSLHSSKRWRESSCRQS